VGQAAENVVVLEDVLAFVAEGVRLDVELQLVPVFELRLKQAQQAFPELDEGLVEVREQLMGGDGLAEMPEDFPDGRKSLDIGSAALRIRRKLDVARFGGHFRVPGSRNLSVSYTKKDSGAIVCPADVTRHPPP